MVVGILDRYYLGIAALICVGWQLCFFVVASATKSDKVTDFAYGTNFMALAAILFATGQSFVARNILVACCVLLWGLRLALYLFARVIKEGRDARFDGTRDVFCKFLAFWIAQCVTVFAISVPFVILFSLPIAPSPLTWQDGVGIALWVVGFAIEVVADQQKFAFKNSAGNRAKMCTIGLWRISRHPNYFGEVLCWWGIWAMCTSAFDANGNSFLYFTVVSPCYICLLLLFLSGIPTLEEPWNKKYGLDAAFRHYKNTVPPFVPFVPALYGRCPRALKALLCCEFPLYAKGYPSDDEAAGHGTAVEQAWDRSGRRIPYQKQ